MKNILSLFDGMSCLQIALNQSNIKYENYFASEIDKYAIKVTQANYANTNQIGDITKIKGSDLPQIDLLCGGSPCFIAGTKVINKDSYKNIEDIVIGDYVLTHKNRFRKVLRIGSSVKETTYLTTQNNIITGTTENHPYYIRKRISTNKLSNPEWVEVKNISLTTEISYAGMFVNNYKENFNDINSNYFIEEDIIWLSIEKIQKSNKVERVYNIEVEEDNSYTANNLIVHNCQGFSFAGKQLNFEDHRSKLFFEYVRILKETNPKYFILENVVMKKEYQDVISQYLGVEPIMINSARVSAQNRKRLYWTNIQGIEQPKDRNIYLKDIIEENIDINENSLKNKVVILKNVNPSGKGQNGNVYSIEGKSPTITTNKGEGNKICLHVANADLKGFDSIKRVYSVEGKSPTVTTMQGGNREPKILIDKNSWRKLTPLECERLQTIPDNFTNHVSKSQRYKMIGNGFTIKVFNHILSYIK